MSPTLSVPATEEQPDTFWSPSVGAEPSLEIGTSTPEELPTEQQRIMRRGVRPYGGGHPSDWSWGCGGSPYRTYGRCDNWKVGPVWQIAVDGIVMTREHADLAALDAQMFANDPTGMVDDQLRLTPAWEQFDRGPGGRITFLSQAPHYVGFQMYAAYEGIEEWNASIVYPKLPLDVSPTFIFVPETQPPPPFPTASEQRGFYYRSSFHSGELNVVRDRNPAWRPYFGVRYIKFDDEINDSIDQQSQPPLPGPHDAINVNPPLEDVDLVFPPIGPVTTTDQVNLFDIENNLIGFQIGLLHDSWRVNQRFALEGFLNGGIYYNRVKYTNVMGTFTTQVFADNTNTPNIDESRIDFSNTVNSDVRELSEIAYVAEASLSGVCRLNKCWALRAGYQVLWINNLHLAQDAFLTGDTEGNSLFFHGWHAGIECRR